MEIEDFETIHLAQEVAREKGWDHVMETIRKALREEAVALPAVAAQPRTPTSRVGRV